MANSKKLGGWGMLVVGAALACTPEVRELGDEPVAGSGNGGSGTARAGAESILPKGGHASSSGGAAGRGPNAAGAPPGPEAAGAPPGPDVCFSPTLSPALAIEPGNVGCPCNDDPPECVRTVYEGRPWDVALYCVDGRWTSAEDGVCDRLAPGCKVNGVSYPSGARLRSPLDDCNTCECHEGELTNFTTIACAGADTVCEEGTSYARRCLGCGPADDCVEYEIGCLSGEGCEDGLCASPTCG